jgi:hypothetical protein
MKSSWIGRITFEAVVWRKNRQILSLFSRNKINTEIIIRNLAQAMFLVCMWEVHGSSLVIKYDLYLEGPWFENRHEIRTEFGRCMVRISARKTTWIWKVRGSNLSTKYDLYLEVARFAAQHEMRPSWNSLQSHSALARQCTYGNLKWASATSFYILSNSLCNIILSLNTLTEGDHILATNLGQPPHNFGRQKGNMRQSEVQ